MRVLTEHGVDATAHLVGAALEVYASSAQLVSPTLVCCLLTLVILAVRLVPELGIGCAHKLLRLVANAVAEMRVGPGQRVLSARLLELGKTLKEGRSSLLCALLVMRRADVEARLHSVLEQCGEAGPFAEIAPDFVSYANEM